jgi:lysyl-tRNA synthetase class 2
MGKASFINIQDQGGKIQIYLKNDLLPEGIYDALVNRLDLGDIIGLSGELFLTKMGELTVKCYKIALLAKNIRPLPNMKKKEGQSFNSFEDKELRYRHRQLDLIANPEIKNNFIKRSKIITSIRSYLDKNNYIEVETPVLQPIYGGASAKPFKTFHNSLNQEFYLRIADELYLKRLIIGGFEKVYEIAKNFRNEGMDRSHNPEFTSLEFYSAYSDLYDMMTFTEDLIRTISIYNSSDKINYAGNSIDLNKPFLKESMFNLIEKYAGKDVSLLNKEELFIFAKSLKLELDDELNYGQILDEIFSKIVEPNLIEPIFVIDYPKAISPLAKTHRNGDSNIVERFELFICGMEFANSFSELNDPVEQRNRLEAQSKLKMLGDEEAQILDENFIQAMEIGMPPTGGVGIGIDRLVMLLTGEESIKDVILFPALRNKGT